METAQKKGTGGALAGAGLRAEDHLCRMLLKLAGSVARRRGLTREEAEDCAAEFARRMLGRQECAAPMGPDGHCFPAWLHRCAENHVTDFCRAKERLGQHEQPWPEAVRGDGPLVAWDFAGSTSLAEARPLREESWQRTTVALDRLPPIMSELLVRHHLHGECIRDLAASCDRTPAAVQLILLRARRQMRSLLERMGLTELELRAYIIASLPVQMGCLCAQRSGAERLIGR
jgi:DNA-directed RNA polymerase specialized sigma24 family protein